MVDAESNDAELKSPVRVERARVFQALRSQMFGADREPVTVGRFEIRRRLGAGATGIVYQAFDPQLQRDVAVKVLSGATGAKQEAFLHEARALARFAHPNVLQIYEVGVEQGAGYLVSEWVTGGTLRTWLFQQSRSQQEIISLLLEAGKGLVQAHQRGITHRDIKPENVLVGSDGRPRISDFGLALSTDSNGSGVGALAIAGTIRYMAPEQLRGLGAEPASDQFSFCVMAFEALFGVIPFEGQNPDELLGSIERGQIRSLDTSEGNRVYGVLCKGLAAKPEARYDTMNALLDSLRAASLDRQLPKPSKQWQLIVATVVVMGLILWGGTHYLGAHPVEQTRTDSQSVVSAKTRAGASANPSWPAENKNAAFDPRLSPLHGVRICLSACIEAVHSSRELYLSWADETGGPTGKERTIRGLSRVTDGCSTCKQHMRMNPLTASLDEMVEPLTIAIDEMSSVAAKAEQYYDSSGYKDDGMAQGKILHPKLMLTYGNVIKVGKELRHRANLLEREEQQRVNSELYFTAHSLVTLGGRELDKIDAKQFEKALLSYEAIVGGMKADTSVELARAKALATTGRELLRNLGPSSKLSTRQRAEMGTSGGFTVVGSPDALLKEYDGLASSRDWIGPCRHYKDAYVVALPE